KDATGAWGTLHYDYNAAGDRTQEILNGQSTTYTYDDQGHLGSLSGRVNLSYILDGYGNLEPGRFSYTYDRENRLTGSTGMQGTTPVSATYGMDGQGQRALATRAGCQNDLVYHYDQQGTRIAESTRAGLIVKEYIVADGRTIAEIDLRPVRFAPTQLDFGDVEVNGVLTRTVTLANRSNQPLNLNGATVTASDPTSNPFHFGGRTPATIPANGSVEVPVGFAPFA